MYVLEHGFNPLCSHWIKQGGASSAAAAAAAVYPQVLISPPCSIFQTADTSVTLEGPHPNVTTKYESLFAQSWTWFELQCAFNGRTFCTYNANMVVKTCVAMREF